MSQENGVRLTANVVIYSVETDLIQCVGLGTEDDTFNGIECMM